MRIVPSAVLAVVGGLLFPCLASAQAIYTPDPTPLERPAPLKISLPMEARRGTKPREVTTPTSMPSRGTLALRGLSEG